MRTRPAAIWILGLSSVVALAGCSARVTVGGRASPRDVAPSSPRAAAQRPEGYDEVREVAPAPRVEVDPQAAFLLRQSGSGPAVELADRTTPTGLTAVALLDTTRAEARGFLPEGGLREVTLEEGQRASVGLELGAGECLTVLAHGGLGVREVDAFVVLGSAPDGDILDQDRGGGPIAVVGGQEGCTRTLLAQHVEVVVLVRKGRGSVVAAVYRGAAARR